MENLFKSKKNVIIIGIIILIVVIGLIYGIKKISNKDIDKEKVLVNEEVIPTVDSNVKVDLEESNRSGEVILTVESAPSGTEEIEYQLMYDAISKEEGGIAVPRGVIGKCIKQLKSNDIWSCQQPNSGEAIVLGTCSSGTCVYDQIQGDINVQLKFTGTYGERIFEKNFKLK